MFSCIKKEEEEKRDSWVPQKGDAVLSVQLMWEPELVLIKYGKKM